MDLQLEFAFPKELIVDNFAGGGGASYAIEQAFGRPVDIAINHDPEAIAMHMANHPNTKHYCESVWDVDPRKLTAGRQVGLAWFSPDCKHFSKAKGGTPVSKNIRGLAWVVIRWAKTVKPRVIILENVEEYETWGPLAHVMDDEGAHRYHDDGRPIMKPCPKRKGRTFKRWVNKLKRLGYKVEWKELKACDYGAPTIRKRLFLVARCDGLPIRWPKPSHGLGLMPYRTAADIIDWSIPCQSIFDRKRPLVEATMRRIARGIERFVINDPDPFIIGIDHQGSKSSEFSVATPLTTITGKARHALVTAFVAKHFGGMTGTEIDKPFPTILARGTQNQLVTAHLMRQFGKSTGSDMDDPVGTVTAGGGGKTGLVTSHMIKLRGTCADGQDLRRPAPTITAGGTHIGEVRAFLMKYYGTGGQWQDCREPLHTVPTKARFGLVTVHGEPYQIVDIGMRMLSPRELYLAQGFPPEYRIDLEYHGKPLTKTSQVRMVGNSVSPPPAIALVLANVGEVKRIEAA
ncbi:MAG: DNA cytosine methyltransferase [Shewanella sp.]|nr:DNA cytosine methyltransferase [Shewanella sp.]